MRPYPLPHRLLSLTLALLVLAASVGLPVQRRTCRLSGRSTARIAWHVAPHGPLEGGAESGPAAKRMPARLAGSCYAYYFQLHQLSVPAHEAAPTLKLPAAPHWLALPAATLSHSLPPLCLVKRAALAVGMGPAAPPSRPGGRRLLARIGVLLV